MLASIYIGILRVGIRNWPKSGIRHQLHQGFFIHVMTEDAYFNCAPTQCHRKCSWCHAIVRCHAICHQWASNQQPFDHCLNSSKYNRKPGSLETEREIIFCSLLHIHTCASVCSFKAPVKGWSLEYLQRYYPKRVD